MPDQTNTPPASMLQRYSQGSGNTPQTMPMPVGDTIQERSVLPPQARESARIQPDPALMQQMMDKYSVKQPQDPGQAVFTPESHAKAVEEAGQPNYLATAHIRRMEDTVRDPKSGRLITFNDPAGGSLIGYGHYLSQDELQRGSVKIGDRRVPIKHGLSEDDGTALLNQDSAYHQRNAKRVVEDFGVNWDKLPTEIKTVTQDLTYQVGPGGLRKYVPYLSALKQGNWAEAKKHVSRYYTDPDTGEKVLDTRRTTEAQNLINQLLTKRKK